MALNPVPSLLPVRVGAGLWQQLQDDRAEGAGEGAELTVDCLSTWVVCFKNPEEHRQEIPVDYGWPVAWAGATQHVYTHTFFANNYHSF